MGLRGGRHIDASSSLRSFRCASGDWRHWVLSTSPARAADDNVGGLPIWRHLKTQPFAPPLDQHVWSFSRDCLEFRGSAQRPAREGLKLQFATSPVRAHGRRVRGAQREPSPSSRPRRGRHTRFNRRSNRRARRQCLRRVQPGPVVGTGWTGGFTRFRSALGRGGARAQRRRQLLAGPRLALAPWAGPGVPRRGALKDGAHRPGPGLGI